MAQQRGAPDRLAVGDLDPVLATKLYVPPRQPGFVPRPRLVEALDEGLARTLYLVSAPAGFGKTALLADWGHNSERVLAWLSLDAGDIDPVRLPRSPRWTASVPGWPRASACRFSVRRHRRPSRAW